MRYAAGCVVLLSGGPKLIHELNARTIDQSVPLHAS